MFQFLIFEYFLAFCLLYDSELNIFGLWTKPDIWRWETLICSLTCHFNKLIENIRDRLINNGNNYLLQSKVELWPTKRFTQLVSNTRPVLLGAPDKSQLTQAFIVCSVQVCRWVLKYRTSKNPLIQMTILNLLPRLAAFQPHIFTGGMIECNPV